MKNENEAPMHLNDLSIEELKLIFIYRNATDKQQKEICKTAEETTHKK